MKTMSISTIDRVRRAVVHAALMLPLMLASLSMAADDPANPHWNKNACEACHKSPAPRAGNLGLKTDTAGELCEGCHAGQGAARACRHVSGIVPDDMQIPPSYVPKLEGGKLVCTTCHDLAVQCVSPSKSYSLANPGFLRDRSSRERGKHCFQCHDAAGFERLNPHQMQAGSPPENTCTFCHASMPVRDERGWLAVDFNVTNSLNDMCTGCHDVQPHPGNSFSGKPVGWEHLAVPSAEIRENISRAEAARGVIFPLDPITGEVHCATCHNPHPGELEGYPAAVTAGMKGRLRVDKICQACHDL